jgi:hypothetical protein
MKRTKLLFLILSFFCLSFFLTSKIHAQCQPLSPITLDISEDYGTVENAIFNLIQKEKPRFKEEDIKSIIKQIEKCERDIKIEIKKFEEKKTDLNSLHIKLLGLRDYNSIKSQISTLELGLEKSQKEVEKSLSSIGHYGLYTSVFKAPDVYEPISVHDGRALRLLTNSAIEDLNGVVMKRYTKIENLKNLKDIIEALSRGKIDQEGTPWLHQISSSDYYIWSGEIKATPCKPLDSPNESSAPSSSFLVVNLEDEDDFESKLKNYGVSDSDIKKIRDNYDYKISVVKQKNSDADNEREQKLERFNSEIEKQQKKIKEARDRLSSRKDSILAICQQLNLIFNPDNIDESANTAIKYIEEEINKDDNKVLELLTQMNNKIEDLQNKNSELQTTIQELKEQKISSNIINNTNTNNTNTNNTNSNNTINNNNITFNIIKFGDESPAKKLTTKEIQYIINAHRNTMLQRSIEITHFNNKHPEFQNVYIADKKMQNANIYNGDKFDLKSIDFVIDDLILNHINNLDDYKNREDVVISNNKHEEIDTIVDNFQNYRDSGSDKEKRIYKKTETEIKEMLYNNKDKVIDTQKKIGRKKKIKIN